MTNREAIEILRDTPIDIRSSREDDIHTLYATAQNIAIDALKETEWIPFTFDETGMLNCRMPDEDEEIIVSNGNWVDTDTMCIDYGETYGCTMYYLDSNRDLDGLAWKPMPKPWKGKNK